MDMDDQRDHAEEAANDRLMHEGDEEAPARRIRFEALVMDYGSTFFAISEAVAARDGSVMPAIEATGEKYGQICQRLNDLRSLAYIHQGITKDARDAILALLDAS